MVTRSISHLVRAARCAALLLVPAAAVLLLEPQAAFAQASPAVPGLHHAPVSVAKSGAAIAIAASIDHPELVKSAVVVYRSAGRQALREVPFLRASDGPYVATIPEEDVRAPSIGYTVEIEPTQGGRRSVFASRAEMQEIEVPVDLEDARELAASQRLGERRSIVKSSAEYVVFGERAETGAHTDRYWRTEASYTYRPLRRIAEFSIRAGVVRGPNPDSNKSDLGLNYGAPSIRVRLGDIWHVEAEFLTSITEVGFSVGTGGALLIGDPYGSKLTLGFESIQVFGTRFYSRMDIAAGPRLLIAPIVEVTDMPHADRFGVRLLTEARFDAGSGFTLGVLGGYQARVASSGGPALGVSAQYAF